MANQSANKTFTANVMIDAYQYILGEYHHAASAGDSFRRESLMDALRIIDVAERSIPFYSQFEYTDDTFYGPGCMPDSEPMGPFATQAEALADAQNYD